MLICLEFHLHCISNLKWLNHGREEMSISRVFNALSPRFILLYSAYIKEPASHWITSLKTVLHTHIKNQQQTHIKSQFLYISFYQILVYLFQEKKEWGRKYFFRYCRLWRSFPLPPITLVLPRNMQKKMNINNHSISKPHTCLFLFLAPKRVFWHC